MPGPSRPTVRLFFACDSLTQDPTDQKWVIKNPWHTVAMPQGVTRNFGQRLIQLYAQLTDGVGSYNLGVELRRFQSTMVLGRSNPEPRTFDAANQLAVHEIVFTMTNVPFPVPDLYEFRLMADGNVLDNGLYYLRVLPG